MTKTSAAQVLLPIWQRVLQRPSIDANDNFFDLGGNPSSAGRLFSEIAEVCGRDLPPVLIYLAPTIAMLTAVLEKSDAPRLPPLLLLKAGTEYPPIFVAHGLGDTVFGLFHLVNKIESSRPIYGMQARGLDGVDEPFTSIEEMARFHVDAIKQLQPQGPYSLIGYSLGGLATLEIAQRLLADGEKVGLLALVDSYPHRSHLAVAQQVRLSSRLAKRMIESALGRIRSQTSEDREAHTSRKSSHDSPAHSAMKRMRAAEQLALRRYHPRFYPGTIKFVKAEIRTYFPDNPVAVWSHLTQEFHVETTPGDHLNMLTTHVDKLGLLLSAYLQKSPAPRK
jgi:acetoacetyl-CoA synthetase